MSFIRKKKQIRFEAAQLAESTSYLHNPSCGWYRIYPFIIEEKQDFEELYWCLCAEESIVLALVDIGAFRDDALPEDALDNLRRILEFFNKHGKEVILRITYDREGRGMEREPDFLGTVIGHMQQLGAVIGKYKDHILVVQGILVGSWGEMHDSKFLSEERLRQLLRVWQEALGDIPIAVRTPQQWRILHDDGAAPGRDKIGLFNDGMFGSLDHLGTYGWQRKAEAGWRGQWCREEEIEFTGRVAAVVPYGGEAVGEALESSVSPQAALAVRELPNQEKARGNVSQFSQSEIIEELRSTGVSYLNSTHDARRLQQWKESLCGKPGVWKQKSMFDYIGCHLGYRFVVRKAELTGKKDLALKIYIENTGFSRMKEPAELVLFLGQRYTLPDDLCGLLPQETREITVQLPLDRKKIMITPPQDRKEAACKRMVSLSMHRKRDKRPIFFANEHLEDGGVKLGVLSWQE